MKTLALSTVVLALLAGHAAASTFPEKAESRVPLINRVYVDDVLTNLPQKKADQIHRSANSIAFGGSEALMMESGTGATPIFSPNR